jgi:hypothetical protein
VEAALPAWHTGGVNRRKRLLLWIGGGTAVFVAIVAAGVLLLFRDSATPVTRDEASFGLDTVVSGTGIGDQGLYSYETRGTETASALGGSTHEYPEESFLAIVPEGCGETQRWQPLSERWDEYLVCDDGSLDRITTYHKWFGVAETHTYVCDESGRVYPAGDETGWAFTCVDEGDTTVEWRYEVIGPDTVDVGGEAVDALHLVATETASGRTVGTGVHDRWVLTDPYLVLRQETSVSNSTESPVGKVDYTEDFSLLITSLTPSG